MRRGLRSILAEIGLVMLAGSVVSACGTSEPKKNGEQASPQKVVALTVYVDVSRSTPLVDKPKFAARAIEHVGNAVSELELGDEIHILVVGSRSADRSVSLPPIVTGMALRIPAARAQVEKSLRDIIAQNADESGDDSTNLLFALENSYPICTPPSKVILLTDGIEASETNSIVQPLAQGLPITLPPAKTTYLKGCAVEFYGIGISSGTGTGIQNQPLSSDQIHSLTKGWRDYLGSAGVKEGEAKFTSIILN